MFEVKVGLPDFAKLEAAMLQDAGRHVTEAMTEATEFLKDQLRKQTIEAGLGQRLANAWRHRVYPDKGKRRFSLEPAGYVWGRPAKNGRGAAAVFDAFARGATIRPIHGTRYVWLPTQYVPKTGRKGQKVPMTPDDVKAHYNNNFVILPARKRGVKIALIDADLTRKGRVPRPPSRTGEKQGRKAKLVHMFTLVRSTKMPLLLDLQEAADAAGAWFVRRVSV